VLEKDFPFPGGFFLWYNIVRMFFGSYTPKGKAKDVLNIEDGPIRKGIGSNVKRESDTAKDTIVCPRCSYQASLGEDSNYCSRCGEKLKGQ